MIPVPSRRSRSIEWDEYAAPWLDAAPQRLWRMHSDALNARLLSRWLPAERMGLIVKTDLFDEAVTQGLYPALIERANHVAAIDISAKVAVAAHGRHCAMHVVAADVRAIPLRDGCADAIVSLSTLDHFDTPDDIPDAMAEVYRILRPGGMLILTMDNPSNPILAVRNSLPFSIVHRAGLVPYPVGRTHGARSMCRLTEEAGFDIVDRTSVMHAPRLLAIQALRLADSEGRKSQMRVARTLMAFERLERLPSRFFTGHFIAIQAIKPN